MSSERDDEASSDVSPTPVEESSSPASPPPSPEGARSGPTSGSTDSRSDNFRQGGVLERRAIMRGEKIGSHYVRKQFTHMDEFRRRSDGVLEATERTLAPRSGLGKGVQRVKRLMLGERLTTEQQLTERLSKVSALAVLSSDAISSVAYATEASLGVLILAGLHTLQTNLIIAACIALLMVVVGTSYWQTIHAYQHGGGSYIVAHDNLGEWPGLVAAAALLIDYILTVSVSVSSGVDALVSAVPALETSLHLVSFPLRLPWR